MYIHEINEVIEQVHLGIKIPFYEGSDICNLFDRTPAFPEPCVFLRYN